VTALLPDRLVVEVVERVLADEAKAGVVAVLLRGSHARGTGDAHSDLDVTAVTHGDPAAPYRTWFAERPGLPPLHVSVGARAIERWLEHGRRPAQWALGLPAIEEARYLWPRTVRRRFSVIRRTGVMRRTCRKSRISSKPRSRPREVCACEILSRFACTRASQPSLRRASSWE
jgi:hypothetical protein